MKKTTKTMAELSSRQQMIMKGLKWPAAKITIIKGFDYNLHEQAVDILYNYKIEGPRGVRCKIVGEKQHQDGCSSRVECISQGYVECFLWNNGDPIYAYWRDR